MPIRAAIAFLFRFFVLWFIDTLSIMFAAWLLPGVSLVTTGGSELVVAAGVAFALGIVNLFVRPLILLLALPLGFFVIFAIGFFVNALMILMVAGLYPAFDVNGLLAAFLCGIIMAAANTLITGWISLDDDDSFFQGVAERLAARTKLKGAQEAGRGLVMLEIDGLSYWHMQRALDEGYMPKTKRLIEEKGYRLSRVDCGIPSQTSACQAGILFGDNYDIPAFRWYDKSRAKTFVSGKDAPEINARYATGTGLLRGGSSINNMMNGDAEKSLLTLADLRSGTDAEKKSRARDIYLLMINPYFVMRTVSLVLVDAAREIWQYWQDKRKDVQPRLNRLKHGYPLIRGATTMFMRDVAEYLVTLDIVRGAPAIYATWPGYDEVAHHTGPSTKAAMEAVSRYDKTIARIADVIRRKAPRHYDLIILSDHGQSFGPTFLQRYGYDLKTFIENHMPEGATVARSTGGDDGSIAMTAVAGELENMAQQDVGGRLGQAAADAGVKAIAAGTKERGNIEATETTQATVFGSGNLAPVYFHFSNNRIARQELDQTYPGLFTALLQHEGVGVVLAYEQDGTPIAWGKNGTRNLRTGAVEGEDPLTAYGDADVRAEQLCRIADFPNNGDLTVFSTLYPDGTVAAMEELIGSHGGMGGEQTDAFLLHPKTMDVGDTVNSADVFKILNARRGTPVEPEEIEPEPYREPDAWAPGNLIQGIRQFSTWLPLAGRAARIDVSAYREITANQLMTGPALLIGLLAPVISALLQNRTFVVSTWLEWLAAWLIQTLVIFGAGRVLTAKVERSRKASYTKVFRGLSFAQSVVVLELLSLIPPLAPFAHGLTSIALLISTWVAAAIAHDLRGIKAVVFPLVMIVVFVAVIAVSLALLQGAAVSLQAIAQNLGLNQ
jgi:uncharacterized membrane protein YvlD (DUF360 family)